MHLIYWLWVYIIADTNLLISAPLFPQSPPLSKGFLLFFKSPSFGFESLNGLIYVTIIIYHNVEITFSACLSHVAKEWTKSSMQISPSELNKSSTNWLLLMATTSVSFLMCPRLYIKEEIMSLLGILYNFKSP